MDWSLDLLKVVTRLPVLEALRPIVCPADQDTIAVGSKAVDDSVVTQQILDKFAIWTLPLTANMNSRG